MTATRNRKTTTGRSRQGGSRPAGAPARKTSRPATARRPSTSTSRRRPPTRVYSAQRRMIVLLLVLLLGFGLVVVRLTQVQALDAGRYSAIGENQRVRVVTLPAERGSVFDRNGQELALSIPQSTVWVNPRLIVDPRAQAEALAPILGSTPPEVEEKLRRPGSFVYLARKVDDRVADRIADLEQPGVFLLRESKRFLPAGDLAASVMGRVGLDNEGLSGLEVQFDKRLSGKQGRMVVERDATGNDIAGGLRQMQRSERGEDLVLTLDRSLQYETERALGGQIASANARGGIAIVMETRTGEVLAMANLERDLETGEVGPARHNAAVTNVYEPGSVNKLITLAGAIESGAIAADQTLSVPYTIKVGNHVFKEHDPHPTENWTVTDIMANSSNVGTIMIAGKLGRANLHKYLSGFGFGSSSGLGFPGESAGLLRPHQDWYSTDMGSVPIGQGVSVTPLQMAAAYNTIANGGVYVAPKLVKATVDAQGRERPTPASTTRRVVSGKTAAAITAMLNEVVRVGTGTRAAIKGYTVAGKTGTARKPMEGARGYKAGAYVSSFAGFVPSERPALTTIVMLDEPVPIYGGLVAAPVFAQVSQYALREMRIPPPPPVAPAPVPAATPESARPVGEAGGGGATATVAPTTGRP